MTNINSILSNPNALFLIIIAFVVLLVYIASVLRKKNIVSTEDLQFTIQALNLSISIADELQLKKVPQLKQITNIIVIALNSVIKTMQGKNKEEIINEAVNSTIIMCEAEGIKIDDKKHDLIVQLVAISLNNKYIGQINDK